MLRDWNSGKIPYHTSPPVIHPSAVQAPTAISTDDQMEDSVNDKPVGDRVLNQLSEAFTLDGLLDFGIGGEGAFDDIVDDEVEQQDLTSLCVSRIELDKWSDSLHFVETLLTLIQ